jgi:hypothetical protein
VAAAWSDIDAWVIAVGLAIAMVAGAAIGWWRGRRVRGIERESCSTTCDGAIVSLLGLLLAFTFSMALMKHEGRRQAAVSDSNAIGDFSACVGLLDDSSRSRLTELLRQYVKIRLSMAESPNDRQSFETKLADIQVLQDELHALVKKEVYDGTPIVVPLVTTFNALTSAHASRLAAVRDRLPPHVVLLLLVTAVLSVVLVGKRYSVAQERRFGAMTGYIAIVCTVVWVTLDLDQPQGGWITVSQEPMKHVLQSLAE